MSKEFAPEKLHEFDTDFDNLADWSSLQGYLQ